MRKTLVIISIVISVLLALTGCEEFPMPTEREPVEPTVRTEIISPCIVKSYDERHWYAGYQHHYVFTAEVYCEEFNITKKFEDKVSGMWINSDLLGLKKGDVINCVIIKETKGDITKYYISKIKR